MTTEKHPRPRSDRNAGPAGSGRGRNKSKWAIVGLLVAVVCGASISVGAVAGFFVGRRHAPAADQAAASESGTTWWTCSMHPQYRLPKPGKCPTCFMDLIPLKEETGVSLTRTRMSPT